MPIRIDISDIAIAKDEPQHRLHLWGLHTSAWDDNCIECGNDPVSDAGVAKPGLRCECGEGVYCSEACKQMYTRDATIKCALFRGASLGSRPTRKHRRALIVVPSNSTSTFKLTWLKVKGCRITIDHPAFDGYFGHVGADKCWLDLAVVNPALAGSEAALFTKLGHGIAIGFASNLMNPAPEVAVDLSWANTAWYHDAIQHHGVLWPGPVVFFCFGYDLRDYVKVSPAEPADVERGAEASMSDAEIWRELDTLRRAWYHPGSQPNSDGSSNRGEAKASQSGPMVWKWKIKERGTSIKILDFSRRDLSTVLHYLTLSQLNPAPAVYKRCPTATPACKVVDPNHPARRQLWCRFHPDPQRAERETAAPSAPPASAPDASNDPAELIYAGGVYFPAWPHSARPMAGAFAVGLPWYVHYSMDINPPFRHGLRGAPNNRDKPPGLRPRRSWLQPLLWTVHFAPTDPTRLALAEPQEAACSDNNDDDDVAAVLVRPDGRAIAPHHARALHKYLRYTRPREWARHGPRGFEAYWRTYARVLHAGAGADELGPAGAVPSPYELESEAEFGGGSGAVPPALRPPPPRSLVCYTERALAYMTLEGLGPEEWRRAELERERERILVAIEMYERAGHGF